MNTETPVIEIRDLVRRLRAHRCRQRPESHASSPAAATASSAATAPARRRRSSASSICCGRRAASVRVFGLDPGAARSGGQVTARLRPRPRRLLPVDDRARHARLLRRPSGRTGTATRKRRCSTASGSIRGRRRATCRKDSGRSSRSSPPSARSPSCSSSTSRRPDSIPSSGANSSRRSSAPIRTAEPGPADGLRLDASDLRVRRADRRVHDHRQGPRGAHARRPTPRASATRRSTRASRRSRTALDLGGARVLRRRGARARDCRERERGRRLRSPQGPFA